MTDFLGQLIARNTGASRSVKPRPLSLFEPPSPSVSSVETPTMDERPQREFVNQSSPLAATAAQRPAEDATRRTTSPEIAPDRFPATHNFASAVAAPLEPRHVVTAPATFETAVPEPPTRRGISPAEHLPAVPSPSDSDGPAPAVSPPASRATLSPAETAKDSLPRFSPSSREERRDTKDSDPDHRATLDLIERLVADASSRGSASTTAKPSEKQPRRRDEVDGIAGQPGSLSSMVRKMVLQTVARDAADLVPQPLSPQPIVETTPTATQAGVVAAAPQILRPQAERPVPKPVERPAPRPLLTPRGERVPLFPPAPSPSSSAPSIRVTIGRVEIRATTGTAGSVTAKPRQQPPLMSLDAYLTQRGAGERR
jgi:hypothetical protein